MTGKKVMTVGDLLAWAYEETQLAESLERMKETLPAEIAPLLEKQVQIRRDRSRWLDEQVDALIGVADHSAEGA